MKPSHHPPQFLNASLKKQITLWLQEDDLGLNYNYFKQLPNDPVTCRLHIKSPMLLCGLEWFVEVFRVLGTDPQWGDELLRYEGHKFEQEEVLNIEQELGFAQALTGERLALNLAQKASSIATMANRVSEQTKKLGIAILDTRKTTPGLRSLEKYATVTGGAQNHRFGQNDAWMIKDNHKKFFGGIKEALSFFQSLNAFYTPVICEIHNQKEMEEALELGIKHLLLDNFSPEEISEMLLKKPRGVTFEASGGITPENLNQYLIKGLDAISMGSLTYAAPAVDLSFKFGKA